MVALALCSRRRAPRWRTAKLHAFLTRGPATNDHARREVVTSSGAGAGQERDGSRVDGPAGAHAPVEDAAAAAHIVDSPRTRVLLPRRCHRALLPARRHAHQLRATVKKRRKKSEPALNGQISSTRNEIHIDKILY